MRVSLYRRKGALVCGVAVLFGMGWTGLQAGENHRSDLTSPETIQGYACDKGPLWRSPDGMLRSCKVDRETKFGALTIPAGSWIHLRPDGAPDFAFMAHDARFGSVVCRGTGPKGFSTAVYPNGNLKVCWLQGDQTVQNVPCAGATMFNNAKAVFDAKGTLKTCTLSADYRDGKRGQPYTGR